MVEAADTYYLVMPALWRLSKEYMTDAIKLN